MSTVIGCVPIAARLLFRDIPIPARGLLIDANRDCETGRGWRREITTILCIDMRLSCNYNIVFHAS